MGAALALHQGLDDQAQHGEAEVDMGRLLGSLALGVSLGLALAASKVNQVQLAAAG